MVTRKPSGLQPWGVFVAFLGVGLAQPWATGCSSKADAPAATVPAGPADGTYQTRGRVQRMSGSGASRELSIHHEDIPDFKSREGETVGMPSMSMPFAVKPGVSLDGIAAGDPVSFSFEVRYGASPMLLVTALTELPPATTLRLAADHH